MDAKTAELINKNKGLLRQLTQLNNRVSKLERRREYEPYPNEQELKRMNVYEGSD